MILLPIAAIAGGATAAVLGFGIGTLITPAYAIEFSFRDAVIMASIPHFAATALRLWILRRSIDLATLKTFGLASAAGGFVGAFALGRSSSFLLQLVFGLLLMVGGISGISARWGRSIEFRGRAVWVAGGIAGLLGGMVGNQGGIRTAAMLGVDIAKYQFVATATAVALIIDVVRLPIYIATAPSLVAAQGLLILVAATGALVGTAIGLWGLRRLSERSFRLAVSVATTLLGISIIVLALPN